MTEFRFQGHSDDSVYVFADGVEIDDTFDDDCAKGTWRAYRMSDGDHSLIVTCKYSFARTGCWIFGVGLSDEDKPVPPWQFRFEVNPKNTWTTHSADLVVTAPSTVKVEYMGSEFRGQWEPVKRA